MDEEPTGAVGFEQGFTITGWSEEKVWIFSCYNMINILALDLETTVC